MFQTKAVTHGFRSLRKQRCLYTMPLVAPVPIWTFASPTLLLLPLALALALALLFLLLELIFLFAPKTLLLLLLRPRQLHRGTQRQGGVCQGRQSKQSVMATSPAHTQ